MQIKTNQKNLYSPKLIYKFGDKIFHLNEESVCISACGYACKSCIVHFEPETEVKNQNICKGANY